MSKSLATARALRWALLSALTGMSLAQASDYQWRVPAHGLIVFGQGASSPVKAGDGTGTPAALTGMLSVSSTALAFESITVGQTSPGKELLVSNTGTGALALQSPSVTGPFTAAHNCPTSLAANASCAVTVSFSAVTNGAATGEMSLVGDSGIPVKVALSGTATPANVTDPYWANVGLLASFDSGLTDSTGKTTLTAIGGASVTTGQSKFGAGALYLNGTSAYVAVNSVVLGAGPFTAETWVKTDGASTDRFIMGFRGAGVSGGIHITTGGSGSSTPGTLRVGGATGGDVWSTSRIDDGAWHHIAVTRDAGLGLRLFVDGRYEAAGRDTTNYTGATSRPVLGVHDYNTAQNYFAGYLDEVRVTPGIARYTASFTAPTAAFPMH